MGAWNPTEFVTCLKQSELSGALVYVESLIVKNWAAIYHKENIQQKMAELNFNSALAKGPAYDYEIAFELDALMITLNSIWSILAQLLNECFVKTDSSEVSFSKFSNPKECCYKLIPSEIQPILKSIRESKQYHTIRAFANVSKHRHVIQGKIHMDFSDKSAQKSYVITEFEYKGKLHKLTLDEAFECLKFMIKSVNQVGAKIHELLK